MTNSTPDYGAEACGVGLHLFAAWEDHGPIQIGKCKRCGQRTQRPYQPPFRKPYDPYTD